MGAQGALTLHEIPPPPRANLAKDFFELILFLDYLLIFSSTGMIDIWFCQQPTYLHLHGCYQGTVPSLKSY